MFKKIRKSVALLIVVVILSSLLIITASGSFFYRNAVLGYEIQKTLLINFNLSYTYLLSSLQQNSREYIFTDNQKSNDRFLRLVKDYKDNDSINLSFDAISDLQASTWLSGDFPQEKSNMSNLARRLDFQGNELTDYKLYLDSFNQLVLHLSHSVKDKDINIFTDPSYSNSLNQYNYYMNKFTSSYLNRINEYEDLDLRLQTIFGLLSLFFSLALAAFGAFVAYFAVITNRNNSYYRKLFGTTVETADFGLAIISMDYKYTYTNKQYKEIMNISVKNLIGKSPLDVLPKEFTKSITKPTSFEEGLINSTVTIHASDNLKHIDVSRFAIRDEKDQINFVTIIRDITDLVNMEILLKSQLKEIEFHSKAKDAFIANITHEIKTPLNAIIGLSYVLKSTELSKKQKSILDRITTSSDLLLNLVNDILDLSKIKNSSFKFYPTNILLTNLLSEIEGIATALIGEKNILWKTEYNYNPELCISTDKTRLTQIILNLISNSTKFTNEGYIKLLVESLEETMDSVVLKFTVEDTGLGMDAKDLGKLFQEFKQLENPLTKQHKGTGLGLIICKNVIDAMGGEIWVESAKDKGSKFIFTVPMMKASPDNFIESFALNSTAPFDGGGKRILVVEDNEINYEVTESLLAEVNIICENAPDGLIALELCKKAPEGYYQLILMDIHMPNMDGYTASKILKNEIGIKTPIIALSAITIGDEIVEEYKNIIVDYIPKPFNFSQLYNTLSPYFTDSKNVPVLHGTKGFNPNDSKEFDPNGSENPDLERRILDRRILTESLEDPFAGKVKAIEDLGGLENLYNKHLIKFKENYSTSYEEAVELLAEGELIDARRLAHSVKGLAGTLGLPYLEKASANLEAAILNDEADFEPFLSAFKNKLEAVCNN
ncbi:MAG TPA: ATP-binding protein [Anaerovoracaceae bacterium]|nr:ATP-binding protein [Anaerovoracaceae bacterium]